MEERRSDGQKVSLGLDTWAKFSGIIVLAVSATSSCGTYFLNTEITKKASAAVSEAEKASVALMEDHKREAEKALMTLKADFLRTTDRIERYQEGNRQRLEAIADRVGAGREVRALRDSEPVR